uniref:Uncharacterized protein n=1 Tax=Glossina palpalis gambiensis TaxID=67801 RepID=A0A1B0BVH1_9MUSC
MVKRNGQHAKQVHRHRHLENGEIVLRRQYINSAIGQYAYGLDSFSFHLLEASSHYGSQFASKKKTTRIHFLSFRLSSLMFLPNFESISDITCK